MCGIIGVLAQRPATPIMLDALQRLEYRGYDSAGVATLDHGRLMRRRSSGKLSNLVALVEAEPLRGTSGLGHTRWATHGSPTAANAHPHQAGPVMVVHNGIIENYRELRDGLAAQGWSFDSETDSEVVATLCASMLRQGLGYADAAAATIAKLRGAYALCFMFEDAEDLMICARRGSPLVIGLGDEECFVGSDAIALAPLTNRILYLEEGDWAVLTRHSLSVHDARGEIAEREVHTLSLDSFVADKGPYRHFMAKEINEQPAVTARLLGAMISADRTRIASPVSEIDWAGVERLTIVACGTAFLAGQVAKSWLETIARLPVEIDIASEFRYREPPLPARGVTLVISQSGETADTLAALRYAKDCGQRTVAMVNVVTSTIAREADLLVPILAGPEIGVASTKAFTAQVLCFAALTAEIARMRGRIGADREREMIDLLSGVPRVMAEALQCEDAIRAVAADIKDADDALFLGRGTMHALAMEGALKLKEISYIHAEGYAAGELKHGPIALVDDAMPVIALAPSDGLHEKLVSNLREVMARKGRVILFTDAGGARDLGADAWRTIVLPGCDPFIAPFVHAVGIQLLAYHVAVAKGTDVDQPRNLAKSVTVE